MPLSREHQDQKEQDGVKDFHFLSWYAVLRFWQIEITNWGWYQCIILLILTHGSRCVVSAWIPVSNYLSASAHWCHSFPVINQSPPCQGQVTSRWAWLVLNWALSPILSHGHATISQQPAATAYQHISSLTTHWKLWLVTYHLRWTTITSILFQMLHLHMMISQIWLSLLITERGGFGFGKFWPPYLH